MQVKFKISGGKELADELVRLGPKVARNIGGKAVRAATSPIVKEMKRLVPKDTRKLERSITARMGRTESGKVSAFVGFKRPRSRIAHLLEFGTSKMSAKPFIRPAMDVRAKEALEKMQAVISLGILRHEWKQTIRFVAEGGEIGFGEE
jgi:HK97 gp10 family phage protein